MPKTPFKNGVSDQTRLAGQEYPGLSLLTLVAMKGMLPDDPSMERHFAHLIFMALAVEMLITQEEYTESFLQRLQCVLKKFLLIYRAVVGPMPEVFSRSGLRIAKFHGLVHACFYIRRYGTPYNFFGGFCESHLKSLVKQQTRTTSRRQSRLPLDIMNRLHEDFVCRAAEDDLREKGWFERDDENVRSTLQPPPSSRFSPPILSWGNY